MEVMQVVGPLVCTQRHVGIEQLSLRILKDRKGKLHVSVDTIGCREGVWVFVVTGTAARVALPDPAVMTDLTICGIIDFWDPEHGQTV